MRTVSDSSSSTGSNSSVKLEETESRSKLGTDYYHLESITNASKFESELNKITFAAEDRAELERNERIDECLYDDEKPGRVLSLALDL